MTGAWGLPMQAELGGVRYAIRSDYRDVLELLRWLNGQADPALDQSERWYVAMRLSRQPSDRPAGPGRPRAGSPECSARRAGAHGSPWPE